MPPEPPASNSKKKRQLPRQIPRSVIRACRDEIDNLQLNVEVWDIQKAGRSERLVKRSIQDPKLPDDIYGSWFIAAALPPRSQRPNQHLSAERPPKEGHCQRIATTNGTFVINGDGMLYRLTFAQGRASLRTRIAKTPCYYADLITELCPKRYPDRAYGFRNGGTSRNSRKLGNRNQLNTAFLKTTDHRLLVTFDAGRPWEIDPETMELLAPVGVQREWLSLFPPLTSVIFPVHMNPAHPVCSWPVAHPPTSDRIFTLNYSVGYKGKFRKPYDRLGTWLNQRFKNSSDSWNRSWTGFTDLVHYDLNHPGQGGQRWRLLLAPALGRAPHADGQLPTQQNLVVGEQSFHQMAITEKYLIFADIAFRMEFSQVFSPSTLGLPDRILERLKRLIQIISSRWPGLARWLATTRLTVGYWLYQTFLKLLSPAQVTNFYIVDRTLVESTPGTTLADQLSYLPAQKVTIQREVSHFTADYRNNGNQIVIHVGHNNGWDVTEWMSQYDKPVAGKEAWFEQGRLAGMGVSATDLNSLARYTIDGLTGSLISSKVVRNPQLTWGVSIYTHHELSDEEQTVKNLYWLCTGFSWELLPDRIFQIYKNRSARQVAPDQLPPKGQPPTLVRLDTERMEIVDWFAFPPGYYPCSPQFMPSSAPCPQGTDPSVHGYITCVVLSDQGDEFWVFDANNLGHRKGAIAPSTSARIYRLRSPQLDMGFSLHSVWFDQEQGKKMRKKHYRHASYRQQIRSQVFQRDYDWVLRHPDHRIGELFSSVREHFVQQTLERDFDA